MKIINEGKMSVGGGGFTKGRRQTGRNSVFWGKREGETVRTDEYQRDEKYVPLRGVRTLVSLHRAGARAR